MDEKSVMNKKGQASINLGTFILVFVTILVGLTFLPAITASVQAAAVNLSATTAVLLGLVPLFYVLLVIAVAAIPVIIAFKRAG